MSQNPPADGPKPTPNLHRAQAIPLHPEQVQQPAPSGGSGRPATSGTPDGSGASGFTAMGTPQPATDGSESNPTTGDETVDAAVADLEAVDPQDLERVIAVGQDVRDRLHQRLTAVDGGK